MTERPGWRLITGTGSAVERLEVLDPLPFQMACVDGFVASQVARGFSQLTIDNDTGVLERFLALADKPAWDLTSSDVDTVVALLVDKGVGAVTRRDYVGTFRQFFAFLQARHAIEIQARFGVRLADPLDRFHAGQHVSSDSPSTRPPPTPARMDEFFEFLRARMAETRKWTTAARDYALFRILYHAGLRSAEAASLEIRDLHFDRGPFGKIHVRLGKAAKGSGPRPRWVPMLDVEQQQVEPTVAGDEAGEPPLVLGLGELVHQPGARHVSNALALLTRREPGPDQQMALAGATVTEEDDRLATLEERERGQQCQGLRPDELARARRRIHELETELEAVKAASALFNGEEVVRPKGSAQSFEA